MNDHTTPAELARRDGATPDEAAAIPPDAQLQPIPLRWGLNDVLWDDDDSVTVMLSGPDGEPYWLELDPERAAVLREDLAGPDGETPGFELRGGTEIRAAALREAADVLAAKRQVYSAPGANIHRRSPLRVQGMADAEAELRRMADETQPAETDAWQREWDSRPNGADVSDLIEIVPVVSCSGTLHGQHPPHEWEPQPGMDPVHCPGERQPAAGARQDGAQR